MEIERLAEWRRCLEVEVQDIRETVQSLNAELQRKSQQIELIARLMGSAGGTTLDGGCSMAEPDSGMRVTPAVTPREVKDHVYEILAHAKRPMNINEIHAAFLRHGYAIPGKGTSFNILVHIGRELKLGRKARFYRAARGTYSLRSFHPDKSL